MGSIRGKVIETAWTNRKVYQFIDLRYAEAPSGVSSFKNPRPIPSWKGIYNAMVEKTGCLSIESLTTKFRHYDIDMDLEDCLTMTITTPNITGNYPVLVYIHGEGLFDGRNNEAPPEYLLEKDIVLVTPQYRLGPFGFLSTLSEDIPGNVGVMDIYLALNFIKTFITSFGGDPNKITLAGQVGGAAIAHALTLSPIVQPGLFHQVIYHSGSALSPVFIDDNPRDHALDIAQRAGCTNLTTLFDLDDCLMRLNPIQLLSAYIEHARDNVQNGGNHFTIGSPVLPVHPTVLMAAMKNFSYPAMGGVPRNAGTLLLTQIFQGDFNGLIPDDEYNAFGYINHVLEQIVGQDDKMIMTSFAHHEFFTPELLENGTFSSLVPSLVDMAGTLMYKLPVLLALNMNQKYLPHQTFLYSFDYRGEFNRYPDLDEELNNQSPFKAGVSLTDEALYLFPNPDHVKHLNPTDTLIAKQMVELWTSFVINGQPSMASNRGGYWPPMTTLYGPYLKIDETLTVGGNYFKEFTATRNDHERGIKLIRDNYYKKKENEEEERSIIIIDNLN
ncbi:glutactin-like [Episyrphus balteatus]|uniref:glutactin-like n=1 Tax=Episyrphus balteatus TaxID=286459 RepID=UPI002484FF9D|nr:glutactin-like [Episyrphus balteatus]